MYLCMYYHWVEATDSVESTQEDSYTITEHLFMLSDDPGQDHDSIHHIQELINKYLTEHLGCKVIRLPEFTDGCAAQYKSRYCLGHLS